MASRQDCLPVERIPELLRRTAFLFLEDTVEIGYIVEPAVVTHIRYRHVGVQQFPRCIVKADVYDEVRHRTSRPSLEEPAVSRRCHLGQLSQGVEPYLAHIIVDYIVFHHCYPLWLAVTVGHWSGR